MTSETKIEELRSIVRSDPDKVVLEAFRHIEVYLRRFLKMESVRVTEVFDRAREAGKVGDLLYQQLKTFKRLRNDIVHQDLRAKTGDALIALGTLSKFKEEVEARDERHQREVLDAIISVRVSPSPIPAGRLDWRSFQEAARRFFESEYSANLAEEVTLDLPSGSHRFDLASLDKSILIECKSYTWTKSGKRPSAKWEAAQRTCGLLAEAKAARKILAFQDDLLGDKSLAREFARLNPSKLFDIEVWRYWKGAFERVEGCGPEYSVV